MATLNITYNGLSTDYPLELAAAVSDTDIKRIAVEVAQPQVAADAFDNFVVDRMQDGQRIYLRPKVPFGA